MSDSGSPPAPATPATPATRQSRQREAFADALRWRIERLVLHNFKSYAGEQQIGPFRNFQAVIGPNGAGEFLAVLARARQNRQKLTGAVGSNHRLKVPKRTDLLLAGVRFKVVQHQSLNAPAQCVSKRLALPTLARRRCRRRRGRRWTTTITHNYCDRRVTRV